MQEEWVMLALKKSEFDVWRIIEIMGILAFPWYKDSNRIDQKKENCWLFLSFSSTNRKLIQTLMEELKPIVKENWTSRYVWIISILAFLYYQGSDTRINDDQLSFYYPLSSRELSGEPFMQKVKLVVFEKSWVWKLRYVIIIGFLACKQNDEQKKKWPIFFF